MSSSNVTWLIPICSQQSPKGFEVLVHTRADTCGGCTRRDLKVELSVWNERVASIYSRI